MTGITRDMYKEGMTLIAFDTAQTAKHFVISPLVTIHSQPQQNPPYTGSTTTPPIQYPLVAAIAQ